MYLIITKYTYNKLKLYVNFFLEWLRIIRHYLSTETVVVLTRRSNSTKYA
jgi:hypothetical protein